MVSSKILGLQIWVLVGIHDLVIVRKMIKSINCDGAFGKPCSFPFRFYPEDAPLPSLLFFRTENFEIIVLFS